VNILNFEFEKSPDIERQHLYYVELTDRISHRVFYNKLALVFMELPNFTKKEHELSSNYDRWMYAIKHLAQLQDLPDALRNRIFDKLFRVAEIAKMTRTEKKFYDQSLKEYRDMYLMENALKKKEADMYLMENALKKKETMLQEKDEVIQVMRSENQVMQTALQKQNVTMVRVLLEAGISAEKIATSTGLSMSEINQIKETL
jgi:primosomal protein N'